jgi:hypothetical protein
VHNILQQIEHIHAYCNTGNAHGWQASAAAASSSSSDNEDAHNHNTSAPQMQAPAPPSSLKGLSLATATPAWMSPFEPPSIHDPQMGKTLSTLLEGTKWVSPFFAAYKRKCTSGQDTNASALRVTRNIALDAVTLNMCNQLASLLMELTKLPDLSPTMDVCISNLMMFQGVPSMCSMCSMRGGFNFRSQGPLQKVCHGPARMSGHNCLPRQQTVCFP